MAANHGFSPEFEDYARDHPLSVEHGQHDGTGRAQRQDGPHSRCPGRPRLRGARPSRAGGLSNQSRRAASEQGCACRRLCPDAPGGEAVHGKADRAGRDLRRPGGDRHRECPAVRRGAGAQSRISEALEQQTATGAILRVIAARRPTYSRSCRSSPKVRRGSATRTMPSSSWPRRGTLSSRRTTVPSRWTLLHCRSATVRSLAAHMPSARQSTSTTSSPAVTNFPKAKAMALRYGHRSIAATPLMRDEEAIGVIVIRRRGGSVQRKADRAPQDLRRSGRHRHPECPVVRRSPCQDTRPGGIA